MHKSESKVLIVEDDSDLRESISLYLEDEGVAVTGAGSADEFYRYLAQGSYDVAVIDIGLPDRSGYVLAEELRRNTELGIIILTARGDIEDRVQGYAVGADLYLVKPVDIRELLAAVVSMTGRRLERSQHPPMSGGIWRLSRSSWHLVSPAGIEIMLTGKEFEFIHILALAEGKPVERKQLMTSLHYPEKDWEGRALTELSRRLRKKISHQTGSESPLHTHHSIGYCFSGSIAIVE
jgi:DNA-binding response OmpR family regulator